MNTDVWRVVGFHGAELRSPALHGPVVVDGGGFLVATDVAADRVRIPNDGPLPGVGTRIGPWPYVAGNVVLVADNWELRELTEDVTTTAAARALLDAVTFVDERPLQACCAERLVGDARGFVAWYAPTADVNSVRALLRDVARERLRAALPILPDATLRDVAWRLQRAATTPDDDIEAMAALRVGGMPVAEVKELLAELVRELPAKERARRFAVAVRDATAAREGKSVDGTRLDVLEKQYAALRKEHDALKKHVAAMEKRVGSIPQRLGGRS